MSVHDVGVILLQMQTRRAVWLPHWSCYTVGKTGKVGWCSVIVIQSPSQCLASCVHRCMNGPQYWQILFLHIFFPRTIDGLPFERPPRNESSAELIWGTSFRYCGIFAVREWKWPGIGVVSHEESHDRLGCFFNSDIEFSSLLNL